MPMYDYRCSNEQCHTPDFESLQKFDNKKIDCPSCGAKADRTEVPQIRHLGGSGIRDYANASSVRFHFNYTD